MHQNEIDSTDISEGNSSSPNHKQQKRVPQEESVDKLLREKETVIDRFRERVMQLEMQLESLTANGGVQNDH